MELDRCPKCAAGVRPGADWCTLCYADLRPPAPVQAPAQAPVQPPPHAPVHASALAGGVGTGAPPAPYQDPATATLDPLAAAYAELLRSTQSELAAPHGTAAPHQRASGDPAPTAGTPAEAPTAGWPCTACRELNAFDATVCRACATPFGLGLATPPPSYDRRQVLFWGLAVALAFVLVVGAMSFFGANVEGARSPKTPIPVGLATRVG